jgi:class 3 adenylate cyclase/tetratricopeptide (TPR) repeat protein
MRCVNCGADNRAGRKFCAECGTALAMACPACGAANQPGEKFCGECGTALVPEAVRASGASAGPTTAPAASERRLVSVLFADLVGFTSLSEDRDPEEVRDLLTRYFETCRQLIGRYGGTVEKFIGDAVMAVWGTPVAREDDAERAVRAAMELTAAVPALGSEVGATDLQARAGVLTGEAAVTIGAEGQGMVAGDLVNTASRIQASARPGDVLVGEVTRRATEAAIAYEEAGTHALKGKAEPVSLWRAVRVVALRGGASKWAGLEPPFVGRDRELRMLKEVFHASSEDRKAHLASVVGIGGIGKSRLVWEFEKYVDGLAEEVWWHSGRCLAYGDGVAFWALADMVRGRAGIVEDEDSGSALAKLRAALAEHVSDPEERRFVEPRLSHLLGLEEGTRGDQENLFSAWRIFFERLADVSPAVMVFEDIHWADSALLDFIEYLLDWSRDRPIFILTLSRPELADRRPTWGAGKRNFTSLFLEPLPAESMDILLTTPVPGLPEELRARILERAEGVPFYAVETVRMLIDRGLIVREGNAYHPTGPIETLEVPESLQALIAARLDGLTADERRLLQDASVLGRTFTVPGLVAMTGLSEPDLEPLLGSLVRKEVLSLTTDPLSSERGQYGFLQDLVKKVAYETMSKRERRARHLAAAEYLERAFGVDEEEIVEVIAAHYLDAHRAAPDAPDAADVKAKARDRLIRAGERAASLGASLEAQRHFERAAGLAEEPLAEAELLERGGVVALAGLRLDQAAVLFERAIALFESEGATHPAARVSARLAEVMWDRGRLREGLESLDQAFRVLSSEDRDEDFASLAAQLGRFMFFSGETDRALERVERALEVAEALGLPEVLSQALNTKALILVGKGRAQEGAALLRFALDVALEHDKPSAALRAYNNLADTTGISDRYQEAESYVGSALDFARRVGNRFWERVLLGMVYPSYALGRWDEVLAQSEQLPSKELSIGRTAFSQGYVACGTSIRVHRGEPEGAARRLTEFADLGGSADVQEQAEYGWAHATLLLETGRPAEALRAAETAIQAHEALSLNHLAVKEAMVVALEAALALDRPDRADELLAMIDEIPSARPSQFLRAHASRFRARLAAVRGGGDRIEADFKGAVGLFREMAIPFWMAVTLLEHGEWLAGQGRRQDAEPLFDEARDVFEGLKARPWLDRLDRIAAATARVG